MANITVKRRYFFFRHGKSEANEAGVIASRLTSRLNDPSLVTEGFNVVSTNAVTLAEVLGSDQPTLISSPFRRAWQTADIANTIFKSGIKLDWRLKERDFGIFDHMSDENYTQVWKRDEAEQDAIEFLVEPIRSVTARLSALVEDMERDNDVSPVILFSHGDIISIGLTYFAGLDLRYHRKIGSIDTGKFREINFQERLE